MTRGARLRTPLGGERRKAGFLDSFAGGVAAALRKEPGVVAVFPALSSAEDGSGKYVNGLGEYLARVTSDLLAERGVTALSGRELVNDIHAANRGLDSLRPLVSTYKLRVVFHGLEKGGELFRKY